MIATHCKKWWHEGGIFTVTPCIIKKLKKFKKNKNIAMQKKKKEIELLKYRTCLIYISNLFSTVTIMYIQRI